MCRDDPVIIEAPKEEESDDEDEEEEKRKTSVNFLQRRKRIKSSSPNTILKDLLGKIKKYAKNVKSQEKSLKSMISKYSQLDKLIKLKRKQKKKAIRFTIANPQMTKKNLYKELFTPNTNDSDEIEYENIKKELENSLKR